jgi:hypothetical protein
MNFKFGKKWSSGFCRDVESRQFYFYFKGGHIWRLTDLFDIFKEGQQRPILTKSRKKLSLWIPEEMSKVNISVFSTNDGLFEDSPIVGKHIF